MIYSQYGTPVDVLDMDDGYNVLVRLPDDDLRAWHISFLKADGGIDEILAAIKALDNDTPPVGTIYKVVECQPYEDGFSGFYRIYRFGVPLWGCIGKTCRRGRAVARLIRSWSKTRVDDTVVYRPQNKGN